MPASSKLATATYILSYVAVKAPTLVTTATIAKVVKEHPTRVRQLVAALARARLLRSVRGARGGVTLGRPAETISLRDIYEAVEDQSLLTLTLKDPFSAWADRCHVHPTLTKLYRDFEERMLVQLSDYRLSQMFTP
jgi:Rrf2 family protein